jgi:hypothetical protein
LLKKKPNKNHWITKHQLVVTASDFHNQMRDILLTGTFKYLLAYQEVPINNIIDTNEKYKIDWYIPDLKLCIELMGEQHYKATAFGFQSRTQTSLNFIAIKERDSNKKALLEEASLYYIDIPYKDKPRMDETYIKNRYLEVLNARK